MSKRNGITERHKTVPYDKIYLTDNQGDYPYIWVFDGKVAVVGKGLDPFRNMSKRNGTRPFPTIKFTILVNYLPYS